METEKIKVHKKIINLIPKCSAFIEAMAENGSIFDKIECPKTTIINHADQSPEAKQKYNKYHNIIVENVPYYKLLALYPSLLKKKQTFVFFNPPQLQLSETDPPTLYLFDQQQYPDTEIPNIWEKKEHRQFLTLVKTIKCNCMICQSPNPLYDKALKKWNAFEILNRDKNQTIRLYLNYPKPLILQDYKHVGLDYKDRQRIKRKKNNFLKKLDSLSEDEKTMILSEIFLKYGQTSLPPL